MLFFVIVFLMLFTTLCYSYYKQKQTNKKLLLALQKVDNWQQTSFSLTIRSIVKYLPLKDDVKERCGFVDDIVFLQYFRFSHALFVRNSNKVFDLSQLGSRGPLQIMTLRLIGSTDTDILFDDEEVLDLSLEIQDRGKIGYTVAALLKYKPSGNTQIRDEEQLFEFPIDVIDKYKNTPIDGKSDLVEVEENTKKILQACGFKELKDGVLSFKHKDGFVVRVR